MKRRKNLERAVVLGLLLSTSVYGSVTAEHWLAPVYVPGANYIVLPGVAWDPEVVIENGAEAAHGVKYGLWVHGNVDDILGINMKDTLQQKI